MLMTKEEFLERCVKDEELRDVFWDVIGVHKEYLEALVRLNSKYGICMKQKWGKCVATWR